MEETNTTTAKTPGGVGQIFLVVTSVQPFSHWLCVTTAPRNNSMY
jgi:hypothetical protein